ncbi:MAG: M67 family metallopeptidase [Chloroflexota bacterium]
MELRQEQRVQLEACARDSMALHAEGGYPNEICGILLGREIDGKRVIMHTMPIENTFEPNEQYHRFLITPKAMFTAEKLARRDRMDVLGVYHSHPNAPARPSTYDAEHAAWTSWTYVILSVQGGKVVDVRGWRLQADRAGFDEIELGDS